MAVSATLIINAQIISPSEENEYCPNTEYSFTVSLPGNYLDISTAGGCSITQLPPNNSGNSFIFKGKFNDVNQAQTFHVVFSGGSKDFVFRKVKSLFYGACTATPTSTVSAPLCEITDIPFSFTAVQWKTEFESPTYCFGSIATYEYLLPAGWKLNGITSDGSTWLPESNSVTFTSDEASGGSIQVRPINTACGSTLKGVATSISINRPVPTFSITPEEVEIQCGTSQTQTFSVSMTGTTSCDVTYSWYLGPNNGWLFNGSPAPITAFTASSSITLISLSTNPNFSNVSVTPIISGIVQPTLTAATHFKAPNLGLIGGSNTICSGTSAPFYLYNAPQNVSTYWGTFTSLPNYGATVVSIDNQYSNSTTLTKINSGVINLHASVTDACNQTYSVTRSNILVGGYTSSELLTGYTLAYPPCYSQGCTPTPVSNSLDSAGPYGTIVYTGTSYKDCTNFLYLYNSGVTNGTWSLNAGSVTSWSSTNGNNLQFYPGGGPDDYAQFRLTVNTSCGTAYYDVNFHPTQYTYYNYYMLAPNPVTSELTVFVDENKLQNMKISKSSEQDVREIIIMDKMGQVKYRKALGKGTRQVRTNVSAFRKGLYIIRIFNGKVWSSMQFIKL